MAKLVRTLYKPAPEDRVFTQKSHLNTLQIPIPELLTLASSGPYLFEIVRFFKKTRESTRFDPACNIFKRL